MKRLASVTSVLVVAIVLGACSESGVTVPAEYIGDWTYITAGIEYRVEITASSFQYEHHIFPDMSLYDGFRATYSVSSTNGGYEGTITVNEAYDRDTQEWIATFEPRQIRLELIDVDTLDIFFWSDDEWRRFRGNSFNRQ